VPLTRPGDGTFTRGGEIVANQFLDRRFGIVAGDFNGDGEPDLAFGSISSSDDVELIVVLGNGDGTFQAPLTTDLGFAGILSLAVGDFNGDGKLDVAATTEGLDSPALLDVLIGKGDGSFQAAQSIRVGANALSLAVADFNGDGKLDLAMTDESINTAVGPEVSILLGVGDGTFTVARSLIVGSLASSLVPVDINHDGIPDLVAALLGVSVVLGVGDGTFQENTLNVGGSGVVALGDFNQDGQVDIAADGGNGLVSVAFGAAASQTARVADAPLTATGTELELTAGVSFTGVAARFSDGDPLAAIGDFSATINWGDGHSSSGTVAADPGGGFDVNGTNTYATAGSYHLRVDIQDSGGSAVLGSSYSHPQAKKSSAQTRTSALKIPRYAGLG
jgi:FG-GAP-like repeat